MNYWVRHTPSTFPSTETRASGVPPTLFGGNVPRTYQAPSFIVATYGRFACIASSPNLATNSASAAATTSLGPTRTDADEDAAQPAMSTKLHTRTAVVDSESARIA
jgi:hypothetical protein